MISKIERALIKKLNGEVELENHSYGQICKNDSRNQSTTNENAQIKLRENTSMKYERGMFEMIEQQNQKKSYFIISPIVLNEKGIVQQEKNIASMNRKQQNGGSTGDNTNLSKQICYQSAARAQQKSAKICKQQRQLSSRKLQSNWIQE
ncbi:hypothetical protein OXYTRIMIC_050 [Oxytricha trifallax]|uniref:Uncharacterized protein n=1 Tax=Oxytricha trifallax TaxID=1172189 RepID=A0A073HYW0_9SPIT|nr:hypothetical protein OXYTRIMIC_050 [Oxytricha trifallax]